LKKQKCFRVAAWLIILTVLKEWELMTKCTALHHSFIRTAGCFGSCFFRWTESQNSGCKIAESVAENDIANMEFNLQNQRKKASGIYQANLDIVSRYESAELKNADVITETAKKQFLAGEINYLEFVILVNQAVTLKTIIPMQSGN
jgi:hypothetical protein